MNKKEVIDAISEKTDLDILIIKKVMDTCEEVLINEIKKGNKVAFHNFGSYQPHMQKERIGRNPKTGKTVLIRESKTIKFKIGKDTKRRLNTEDTSKEN